MHLCGGPQGYGKAGLLSLKEDRHSGDVSVTCVNRTHPLYTSYTPYKVQQEAVDKQAGAAGGTAGGAEGPAHESSTSGTQGEEGGMGGGGCPWRARGSMCIGCNCRGRAVWAALAGPNVCECARVPIVTV